jgi:NADPH:quinone reductase-like Zn-dependent oxidoreductase
LSALALVPFPKGGLGSEASGVVCRVGPQVKDLCVGDRVMLMSDGAFSTHVIASEYSCEKIPDSLTFEDAATMPAVFTTAVASLFNVGGLQKGQVS